MGEWNYAYYALHELHIPPDELAQKSREAKAAIFAMIEIRIKKERQNKAKFKRK
ncbi:hypothetical protein Desor_5388 [Desulfosporosinus orientis DSM 765]|uniref:Uncharacterized protein n=1 Tax=Desulfosporosinus orientis (strain ATCC 19365 / DSM 765 / NCIMB 8382 / VKM B-1628 / Singapore I) TaxID=768706 RepID=G7WEF1_DESOD|nr:hypothetical protein [Desulfosporosinus orientis]AET70764.1 hypothetical protein Desor_5388 [Desulfosporosinus orientis DSM 765]